MAFNKPFFKQIKFPWILSVLQYWACCGNGVSILRRGRRRIGLLMSWPRHPGQDVLAMTLCLGQVVLIRTSWSRSLGHNVLAWPRSPGHDIILCPVQEVLSKTSWLGRPGQDILDKTLCPGQDVLSKQCILPLKPIYTGLSFSLKPTYAGFTESLKPDIFGFKGFSKTNICWF